MSHKLVRPADRRAERRSGPWLYRRQVALATFSAVVCNAVGAIVVVVLLVVVLPLPAAAEPSIGRNLLFVAGYLPVAVTVGIVTGVRRARKRLDWLREDRIPTEAERRDTVAVTWAVTRMQLYLWLVAAVLFALLNAGTSVLLAVEIALTVLIGGMTSAASSYLLVERHHRAVVARAMADAPLPRGRGGGVAWRTIISWVLGTALPVAGLVLLSGLAIGLDIDRRELAIATFVLGLTTLLFGLLIMIVLAKSIADPLRVLRRAVLALADGDTQVRVPVYDCTEVGVLQAGFNQLAAGIAERDEIRDLFGRHVGEDVARQALEAGVVLGGEVREVAVLFVDVVGSTSLAEHTSPTAVVERLNAFLGAVVEVVDSHGGLINTFQGDAALAVWGAPLAHRDPQTAALAAARALAERLQDDEGLLAAGIGVSSGRVVAGNIGAAERLQYTVIGDPVNEAARLTERAKDEAGGVLASASTVAGASAEEQAHWQQVGAEVLRGRSNPTGLAVPTG